MVCSMSSPTVLLVEDDKRINEIVKLRLERAGFSVTQTTTAKGAMEQFQKRDYDIILLDIMLPDQSGLDVLRQVRTLSALSEVIILTAGKSLEVAVEGIKLGAFDYIAKPIDFDQLIGSVKKAADKAAATRQQLAASRLMRGRFPVIIRRSSAMKTALEMVEKAARSNSPVLITGESGTGKELVAKEIHMKGIRARGPFVPINCGGLPDTLVDSELFGHEKGAFTGAMDSHRGLFEIAHRGTLFMDEIGEMSPAIQTKLLRVLESGEFRRIGGSRSLFSDARIIAATNSDPVTLAKQGKFREDLFYRLNTLVIHLPPLRDRTEDIEPLARYFIDIISQETLRPRSLSQEAIKAMEKYSWPGNVRELRNLIERMVLIVEKDIIDPSDLPTEVKYRESANNEQSLSLEKIEKQHIIKVLSKTDGNRKETAKILEISERTLYRKLKQYGLEP